MKVRSSRRSIRDTVAPAKTTQNKKKEQAKRLQKQAKKLQRKEKEKKMNNKEEMNPKKVPKELMSINKNK